MRTDSHARANTATLDVIVRPVVPDPPGYALIPAPTFDDDLIRHWSGLWPRGPRGSTTALGKPIRPCLPVIYTSYFPAQKSSASSTISLARK
jgi:hypothetical protein